jgi:hypothetical protein
VKVKSLAPERNEVGQASATKLNPIDG